MNTRCVAVVVPALAQGQLVKLIVVVVEKFVPHASAMLMARE